jgi:hypothetical protein
MTIHGVTGQIPSTELSSRPERSEVEGPAVCYSLGHNCPTGLGSISAAIAGCPTSRSFVARCGIPQAYPSNLSRTPQLHTGALRSHQRTWAENVGRSPSKLCPLSFPNQHTNPYPAVYKPAANTYAPRSPPPEYCHSSAQLADTRSPLYLAAR